MTSHVDPPTVCLRVHDVRETLDFYTRCLRFTNWVYPHPDLAIVTGHGMRLLLSANHGPIAASESTSAGAAPESEYPSRLHLSVTDMTTAASALRVAGVRFRSEITVNRGERQLLVEDPSGNLIELIERQE